MPLCTRASGAALSAPPPFLLVHPYVLLSFQGRPDDVMTLAHELGHGVHQYLSRPQGILSWNTPLTTAETASIFGETLVFQDLMSREKDPAVLLGMLVRRIESSFATVFRQVAMNRFEDAAHRGRAEGELTTERFSQMWLSTQRAMFGDSVTLTEDYGIWWSYIPHFIHTPGYVYAYAFGDLLVRALFARYREAGREFPERYLQHARRRRLGLAPRAGQAAGRGPERAGLLASRPGPAVGDGGPRGRAVRTARRTEGLTDE